MNATIAYQHLDTNKDTHNLTFNWNSVVQPNLQPAKESMESLTNKFKDAKVKTYNLEEMIHSDLTECENMLKDFLQFLQIDIKNPFIKKILEYDAPNFVSDAYWWDRIPRFSRIQMISIIFMVIIHLLGIYTTIGNVIAMESLLKCNMKQRIQIEHQQINRNDVRQNNSIVLLVIFIH